VLPYFIFLVPPGGGNYLKREKLSTAPKINPAASIIETDLIKSLMPNSLSRTTNVAMQGKDAARSVAAINICLALNPRGISIPAATSFLTNPIARAITVSLGKPNNPWITGAKSKR